MYRLGSCAFRRSPQKLLDFVNVKPSSWGLSTVESNSHIDAPLESHHNMEFGGTEGPPPLFAPFILFHVAVRVPCGGEKEVIDSETSLSSFANGANS